MIFNKTFADRLSGLFRKSVNKANKEDKSLLVMETIGEEIIDVEVIDEAIGKSLAIEKSFLLDIYDENNCNLSGEFLAEGEYAKTEIANIIRRLDAMNFIPLEKMQESFFIDYENILLDFKDREVANEQKMVENLNFLSNLSMLASFNSPKISNSELVIFAEKFTKEGISHNIKGLSEAFLAPKENGYDFLQFSEKDDNNAMLYGLNYKYNDTQQINFESGDIESQGKRFNESVEVQEAILKSLRDLDRVFDLELKGIIDIFAHRLQTQMKLDNASNTDYGEVLRELFTAVYQSFLAKIAESIKKDQTNQFIKSSINPENLRSFISNTHAMRALEKMKLYDMFKSHMRFQNDLELGFSNFVYNSNASISRIIESYHSSKQSVFKRQLKEVETYDFLLRKVSAALGPEFDFFAIGKEDKIKKQFAIDFKKKLALAKKKDLEKAFSKESILKDFDYGIISNNAKEKLLKLSGDEKISLLTKAYVYMLAETGEVNEIEIFDEVIESFKIASNTIEREVNRYNEALLNNPKKKDIDNNANLDDNVTNIVPIATFKTVNSDNYYVVLSGETYNLIDENEIVLCTINNYVFSSNLNKIIEENIFEQTGHKVATITDNFGKTSTNEPKEVKLGNVETVNTMTEEMHYSNEYNDFFDTTPTEVFIEEEIPENIAEEVEEVEKYAIKEKTFIVNNLGEINIVDKESSAVDNINSFEIDASMGVYDKRLQLILGKKLVEDGYLKEVLSAGTGEEQLSVLAPVRKIDFEKSKELMAFLNSVHIDEQKFIWFLSIVKKINKSFDDNEQMKYIGLGDFPIDSSLQESIIKHYMEEMEEKDTRKGSVQEKNVEESAKREPAINSELGNHTEEDAVEQVVASNQNTPPVTMAEQPQETALGNVHSDSSDKEEPRRKQNTKYDNNFSEIAKIANLKNPYFVVKTLIENSENITNFSSYPARDGNPQLEMMQFETKNQNKKLASKRFSVQFNIGETVYNADFNIDDKEKSGKSPNYQWNVFLKSSEADKIKRFSGLDFVSFLEKNGQTDSSFKEKIETYLKYDNSLRDKTKEELNGSIGNYLELNKKVNDLRLAVPSKEELAAKSKLTIDELTSIDPVPMLEDLSAVSGIKIKSSGIHFMLGSEKTASCCIKNSGGTYLGKDFGSSSDYKGTILNVAMISEKMDKKEAIKFFIDRNYATDHYGNYLDDIASENELKLKETLGDLYNMSLASEVKIVDEEEKLKREEALKALEEDRARKKEEQLKKENEAFDAKPTRVLYATKNYSKETKEFLAKRGIYGSINGLYEMIVERYYSNKEGTFTYVGVGVISTEIGKGMEFAGMLELEENYINLEPQETKSIKSIAAETTNWVRINPEIADNVSYDLHLIKPWEHQKTITEAGKELQKARDEKKGITVINENENNTSATIAESKMDYSAHNSLFNEKLLSDNALLFSSNGSQLLENVGEYLKNKDKIDTISFINQNDSAFISKCCELVEQLSKEKTYTVENFFQYREDEYGLDYNDILENNIKRAGVEKGTEETILRTNEGSLKIPAQEAARMMSINFAKSLLYYTKEGNLALDDIKKIVLKDLKSLAYYNKDEEMISIYHQIESSVKQKLENLKVSEIDTNIILSEAKNSFSGEDAVAKASQNIPKKNEEKKIKKTAILSTNDENLSSFKQIFASAPQSKKDGWHFIKGNEGSIDKILEELKDNDINSIVALQNNTIDDTLFLQSLESKLAQSDSIPRGIAKVDYKNGHLGQKFSDYSSAKNINDILIGNIVLNREFEELVKGAKDSFLNSLESAINNCDYSDLEESETIRNNLKKIDLLKVKNEESIYNLKELYLEGVIDANRVIQSPFVDVGEIAKEIGIYHNDDSIVQDMPEVNMREIDGLSK